MSSTGIESAALDLVCVLDDVGRVQQVLRAPVASMANGLQGRDFAALVAPDSRPRLQEMLAYVVQHGHRRTKQCELVADGIAGQFLVTYTKGPVAQSVLATASRAPVADDDTPAKLRRLEALDRVDRILVGSKDLDSTIHDVLREVLDLFECDRAYLLYPCDPNAKSFRVPMECTRPPWTGARELNVEIPMTPLGRMIMQESLAGSGTVRMDPECNPLPIEDLAIRNFGVLSLLSCVVRMPGRETWCLGIHHCAEPRVYADDAPILAAIANRLSAALASLLQQQELERSNARFRTLLTHAPEAIVILDVAAGRYIEFNGNAETLFGWSQGELLELGPSQTSPQHQPDGQPSAAAAKAWIERALAGEAPVFEWTHLNSRGEEIPCEVRLVRLPDADRMLVRGSVIDISGRKRNEARQRGLEEQLRQAQKMEALGQLTGGVAHDFNNILTVIMGNCGLAKSHLPQGQEAHEFLDEAIQASRKGALLTQRLLAFSRKQALVPTPINLSALVRGMEDMLVRSLGETIKIETVLGAGLWNCEADRAQLENAILNLAINARDAMPDGGKLTIEVSNSHLDTDYCDRHSELQPGQYVLLAISDDGTGMTPEVLAQAFEPFFSTKDVGKGSGLGLSMVYGFAKQSRGHVKLYSELGQGTTVRLYLPRSLEVATESPAHEVRRNEASGKGEWILVVEDDASVRSYVVRVLESIGYNAHQAASAREALELLTRKIRVDLLLTDVVLPGGINGAELARSARREREGLRVLFMSGYTENAIIHHGRLDPGVELLSKPFSREKLARSVRDALDREVDA